MLRGEEMETKEIIKKYFIDFLNDELSTNDYYYSIMEYRNIGGTDGDYYEIGMKNIEDLIYDDDGELIDDSKEYDLIIERFINYLYTKEETQKYLKTDKHYVENIFNELIEKIIIYCY